MVLEHRGDASRAEMQTCEEGTNKAICEAFSLVSGSDREGGKPWLAARVFGAERRYFNWHKRSSKGHVNQCTDDSSHLCVLDRI